MVAPITDACKSVFSFINKGLNHPNFFGRIISWSILVGAGSLTAYKTYTFIKPKLLSFCEATKDIITKRYSAQPKNEQVVRVIIELVTDKNNNFFLKRREPGEIPTSVKDKIENIENGNLPAIMNQVAPSQEGNKNEGEKPDTAPKDKASESNPDQNKKKTSYWPFP